MNEPLKILFKYPCRGREKLFFESLDSLNNNIRDKNNYLISLTLDEDDEILNHQSVIQRLSEYPNVKIGWGFSDSKVHAINRDFPDYDADVICCWSNDMFATMYGFDDIFRESIYNIANIRGDFDFLVHFPEPDSKEYLNVLYVATATYYKRFNYIYHPSYKSLWCDNESMQVAQILGRYYFVGCPGLYVHKNPAYGHLPKDDKFIIDQDFWSVDEANFTRRKELNFPL